MLSGRRFDPWAEGPSKAGPWTGWQPLDPLWWGLRAGTQMETSCPELRLCFPCYAGPSEPAPTYKDGATSLEAEALPGRAAVHSGGHASRRAHTRSAGPPGVPAIWFRADALQGPAEARPTASAMLACTSRTKNSSPRPNISIS